VPLSKKDPLPYSKGEFAEVHIGHTPENLLELLGQPNLKVQDDSLWIYGRTSAVWTDNISTYWHEYRAILVEFGEGKVKHKDILHGDCGYFYSDCSYHDMTCWGNRICLAPIWDARSDAEDEPKILSRRYSAVISRRDDDTQAKRFSPKAGHCAIYVYAEQSDFNSLKISIPKPPVISVGSIRDEPVSDHGYLYFQSVPQLIELKAGGNSANIECQAGAIYFYELDRRWLADEDDIRIKSVSTDEGKKAVRKRLLLVTW
jgi:hypothetical protein